MKPALEAEAAGLSARLPPLLLAGLLYAQGIAACAHAPPRRTPSACARSRLGRSGAARAPPCACPHDPQASALSRHPSSTYALSVAGRHRSPGDRFASSRRRSSHHLRNHLRGGSSSSMSIIRRLRCACGSPAPSSAASALRSAAFTSSDSCCCKGADR